MGGAQTPCAQLGLTAKRYLYGPFRKALEDCMFMLDDEMLDALIEWFRQRPKEFFADWIN